jgi:hypothetical protein
LDSLFARKIEFEISEIDLFFESYSPLLEKAREKKIKAVETLALASLLHTFYNCVENIFLIIEKETGGKAPEGTHRHRLLLESAGTVRNGRPRAISESTKNSLKPYLGFHHLYRSSPSIDFDKHKLGMLADDLFLVWENCKSDLRSFLRASSDPIDR